MFVRDVQSLNAAVPMVVTLLGMLILSIELQPEKASWEMLVTGKLLYVEGITISLSVQVPIPLT